MSSLFNDYQKICSKYDKLLNDYANVLTKLKQCRKQLYDKNDKAINSIRSDIKELTEVKVNPKTTSYFCPHISNYCMYIGSDFCLYVCNERRL